MTETLRTELEQLSIRLEKQCEPEQFESLFDVYMVSKYFGASKEFKQYFKKEIRAKKARLKHLYK